MYKVSTILPSFLEHYDGSASDRQAKFIRAVDSWTKQTHAERELIIVSDGCDKTCNIVESNYSGNSMIKLLRIKKQRMFSGNVRQAGLEAATGDVVCYLDSDDYFNPSHVSVIAFRMFETELDWVYYNDYMKISSKESVTRNVSLHAGSAGTSSIAHKRSLAADWSGCDGYGHDWVFIERLKKASSRFDKIYGCGYVVCHTPNGIDN